jgi:hypothetical protein
LQFNPNGVTAMEDKEQERDAYRIPEFCVRHGFSQAKYFQLKLSGEGPREMRVGKRVLISKESAAEWRRSREAAAATDLEKGAA